MSHDPQCAPHPDPLPLVEDRDEGMPADELQTITPSPNPYSLSSMTGEIPGERASSENFDVHPGLALEAQDPVQMPPQPSAIHPWSSALDAIQTVLLEVVAEKTGYPAEMLEPGMQLDADLGIDSIKRVEILSALQERCPRRPRSSPSTWARSALWGRSLRILARSRLWRRSSPEPPSHPHLPCPPAMSRRCFWRSWPRRQATRPRCSNPGCNWTRIWASIRSSGSRSSRRCRSACPRRPRSSPSTWARSAPWDRLPSSWPRRQILLPSKLLGWLE